MIDIEIEERNKERRWKSSPVINKVASSMFY